MKRVSKGVEFVEKQKERASRFMKRRTTLINKAREFSILCGVDACMIIKAPKEDKNDELVDTVWSSSSDSDVMVQKLIKKYKETSEDRKNKDYSVSKYFLDKKREAETQLVRLKKKNCKNREAVELLTWDSKFDTMKEHELRDLANDLQIKIDNLKSRRELMRMKTRIDSSYESSPLVDHESQSTGNLQAVSMMEPNYLIPTAMNSLHYSSNNYSQAIVQNQMTMNSSEDENNFNFQAFIDSKKKMAMDSIDDSYYVQPIANPIGLPMFDPYTPTNSQPQFSFSHPMNRAMMSSDVPESFVYDHYTPIDSQHQFSSSSLMNPAMMRTHVPESFVYDHNAYNFSVFGCLPMQQAYVYGNYRMENSVQTQSCYDLPLPPLMFDHSTNGHVSSQMQSSEQQPGLL